MPRQGPLLKGSAEFLSTLWYSAHDAELRKHTDTCSYHNYASALWELNDYNMPRSVSELVPPSLCNTWNRQHASEKQKIFDTWLKHKGLRSRIRRLTNYQPQKYVQTTSEVQLTTFQQRKGILPDSSISDNCHVFMYLSPIDNRLLDIKVPQSQPLFTFLSNLHPVTIFFW